MSDGGGAGSDVHSGCGRGEYNKGRIRVLSLDGGGPRILLALKNLQLLDDFARRQGFQFICSHDILTGASAGGITVLILAAFPPEAFAQALRCAIQFWNDFLSGRMTPSTPRERLEAAFNTGAFVQTRGMRDYLEREIFCKQGRETLDQLYYRVIIPAFRLDGRTRSAGANPCAVKNQIWHARIFDRQKPEDGPLRAADIALATSTFPGSAPIYSFPDTDPPGALHGFIDGGIFAGNPALAAFYQVVAREFHLDNPDSNTPSQAEVDQALNTVTPTQFQEQFNVSVADMDDISHPNQTAAPASAPPSQFLLKKRSLFRIARILAKIKLLSLGTGVFLERIVTTRRFTNWGLLQWLFRGDDLAVSLESIFAAQLSTTYDWLELIMDADNFVRLNPGFGPETNYTGPIPRDTFTMINHPARVRELEQFIGYLDSSCSLYAGVDNLEYALGISLGPDPVQEITNLVLWWQGDFFIRSSEPEGVRFASGFGDRGGPGFGS